MSKRFEVSVTIFEIDENGESIDEGYEGDLQCELVTDANPVVMLLQHLQTLPGAEHFCT